MCEINKRVKSLDVTLYDTIMSQTTEGDRRSLLAVHRAISDKHNSFAYLEIGSHMGGSIQPYLLDSRCKTIYSIDPRPQQSPDDRSPGYIVTYEDNSTERMLRLLASISHEGVAKVKCFDSDACNVDVSQISIRPLIALIDGEHTVKAAKSDFQFCDQVIDRDGVILFHDFDKIYHAILDICSYLDKNKKEYLGLKLEGSVFAIFFDINIVKTDAYFQKLYCANKHLINHLRICTWLNKIFNTNTKLIKKMVTPLN